MAFQHKLILVALLITLIIPVKRSFAAEPVKICGEPWAPFIYKSTGNSQESENIAGLHMENFPLLEKKTGLKFTFSILPWKRCLQNVENYSKPGDFEIAIDASFSTERAEKYHYVGPIYATSTAVWYSLKRFPDGPRAKKTGRVVSWINEMQHFSICGKLGYNYEMYYVEHGIPRSNQVIRSPGGLPGIFSMLSKGRCDLIEFHPSNVIGAMVTGELDMPKDIACSKMNEEPEKFYMMVTRKSPRSEELIARLSTALIYLKRTLQWKSIKDKGFLPASGSTNVFRKCL